MSLSLSVIFQLYHVGLRFFTTMLLLLPGVLGSLSLYVSKQNLRSAVVAWFLNSCIVSE
jgi:hypothetical protein